jgi:limonene-1,2-epoxide hydrolase
VKEYPFSVRSDHPVGRTFSLAAPKEGMAPTRVEIPAVVAEFFDVLSITAGRETVLGERQDDRAHHLMVILWSGFFPGVGG